jgi:ATP-dependent Clp protease protease subunit
MGLYDDTVKLKDSANKIQSNPALLELEFGLELAEGVVYILDEIDLDTLYRVVRYSRAIMTRRGGPTTDPLTYFIASYGGDLYATFGIIDFMKSFQTPVNTLVRGTAMSAAALLTAAGTGVRQISRNSVMMFHEFTTEMFGKSGDIVATSDHIKVLQKQSNNWLASVTNKTEKWWATSTVKDLYLSPNECLKMGIVDKIVD